MQSFTLGTTSSVCSLLVSLSSISVVSGPVRKGWGTVRVQGVTDAGPPPKGLVITIIPNVGQMYVPARYKILQENERELLERTE